MVGYLMEILTLNDDFQVEGTHSEFYSLVWTERYVDMGDFQLVTYNIETMMNALPLGKTVTLRDTDVCMMVETHEIAVDDNGQKALTITGRTWETIFNFRHINIGYWQKKTKMPNSFAPSTAAANLMWDAVCNFSETCVTTAEYRGVNPSSQGIAAVCVTDSTDLSEQNGKTRWTSKGDRLVQIREFLGREQLGIRTIRPGPYGTSGRKIRFTVGSTIGDPVREQTNGIMLMRFDIYKGVDRRDSQSANAPMVFRADQGDFTGVSYLFSIKDFYNAVFVDGIGSDVLVQRGSAQNANGRELRVMYYEAPDVDIDRRAEYRADLRETGWDQLRLHTRRTIFNGKVAANLGYRYGRDYGLGDRVTVIGEYKYKRDMYVSEYVRSYGPEGVEEYPALVELFDDTQ